MRQAWADFDSAWKDALEHYFPLFLEFFFPEIHADIDWSRGHEFLDKELQQAVRRAGRGRRTVDKLVRVWRKSGAEAWVLVHVEIQSQVEEGFGQRMLVCSTLLFSRHKGCVVSLGILGDTKADWRPSGYAYGMWGCEVGIRFPVVKLLDYEGREEELRRSRNPFAILVLAHLKTQSTRRNSESRLRWKVRILRWLYGQGFKEDQFTDLFRYIDLMMALPEDLEQEFTAEIERFEEERRMPLISPYERRAAERGSRQEAREALIDNLRIRFLAIPAPLGEQIARIEDTEVLRSLRRRALQVDSLEEFEREMGSLADAH